MTSKTKATARRAAQTPPSSAKPVESQFPNVRSGTSPVPWARDERVHPGRLGTADAADPRHGIPDPAAEGPRPAAASRVRDHLAPGPRPGRVRLPALDRPDPRLARDLRGDRVRDHVPPAARDHVAGERAPDRQRRRLHPPRAGHAARRLVEPERLVDLRRHGRGVDPLEARDPVPRAPRLQPLELRPRALLRAARRRPRRSARLLVGADVAVDGARARDHPRRRVRDPLAAPPARDRRRPSGSRSRSGSP